MADNDFMCVIIETFVDGRITAIAFGKQYFTMYQSVYIIYIYVGVYIYVYSIYNISRVSKPPNYEQAHH